MQEVSVVILNWNGKDFLEKFLPTVIANSSQAKIIVADNASSDNSISFLQENHPNIEIIQNSENGGFAKGYNDALRKVKSKYYVLLNSDIEVTPNWLEPLLAQMKKTNVAGCQPKVRSYNDKSKFEHAGAVGGFLDRNYYPFCRGRIFDKVEPDNGQYDSSSEIFWATGAALCIRSEVFWKLDGFDESFFAHMEEIDLCWRAKSIGYSFYVVPNSTIYHVGGGTLPYSSPRKTYLNFRNSLYMLIKNHSEILLPKFLYRLFLDGVAGVRFLFKGEFKHVFAILKAHFSVYANFQSLLKKRRAIRKSRTTPNNFGMYRGNILWAYYVKKIDAFSRLNQHLFRE